METQENCTSYIDGKICTRPRETDSWCAECADILLPKYKKHKELEERYYNPKIIRGIRHNSVEELLSIYAKIERVIELRKEVRNSGFQPRYRDEGHLYRIESLRRFLGKIEKMLGEKYQTVESTASITEKDDEVVPEIKKCVDLPKIQTKQTKPSISLEEERVLNFYYMVDLTDHTCNKIAIDLIEEATKFLEPRFGKYFVRAFILQQKTLGSICYHGYDAIRERKKPKKFDGKEIRYVARVDNHRFVSYKEIIDSISTRDHTTSEDSDIKFVGYPSSKLLNLILILYEYIPQLPLPPYMDYIKFTLDDNAEREIENFWQNDPKVNTKHIEEIKNKMQLIKTKRGKNPACLNNCIRTLQFGEIGDNQQLVCELATLDKIGQKDRPNHIAIRTKKIGEDIESTPWDLIDMTNFRCICTHRAILKFNTTQNLINSEDYRKIFSILSPCIFI